MTVKRITANIATADVAGLRAFYVDLLGLDLVMDMGWIATLAAGQAPVQLSLASQGGSGTPVPDLSIEVTDIDDLYRRAQTLIQTQAQTQAQTPTCAILYPLTDEPWGVRRFYLRDPAGKVINFLAHTA